jgi:hypothetical protein
MEMLAHMRAAQLHCQKSPQHMINAGLMALLSARQQWSGIGSQMADVADNGVRSKYLFGYKRAGYKYLLKHADALYTETMTLEQDIDLLDLWSTVPGLGLAKAGFVVQLVRGRIGCIDSHNAKLYDVGPGQLRLDPRLTVKGRNLKLEQYIDLCEALGGSTSLWKQWCILMAAKYPQHFKDARAVSAVHLSFLKLGPE